MREAAANQQVPVRNQSHSVLSESAVAQLTKGNFNLCG